MKTLILLRHAKSSWEYAVADRNRPLKEKGIRRIQAMASVSREVFGSIPHFYSSPGNRALHTATILLHELNLPLEQLQIKEALYTFDTQALLDFIQALPNDQNEVCLVGHNPALTMVAAKLSNNFTQHLPTAAWVKIIFVQQKWSSIADGTASWGLPQQLLVK
jgi:phosphohistidine phosphatase